ncbi:MAG TPA: C25 family cysteine peptidase, partial [Anaerolineaceae bacterium]|nr:C25 family cysteine peptidase [Anaerolineaceae bacterium]
ITVQAAIPGANVQTTTLNARSYAALSGEGFVQGGEVGAPNLPVVRRDIEVPFGAEISLEVLALTSRTTTLAEAGLTGPIAPVQAPQPKCGEPLAANEPAAEIYSAAAAYPEAPVRIAGEYTVRGHRVVTVEIWPVAYTPATGGLELISEVSFRLKLAGSDLETTNTEAERLRSDAFETILARNILNYNQGRGAIAAKTPENYLIITADVYEAGLADFVALKQSQGFNVTLANLTTVGGTTTTAIKNYIVAAYNGANPPAYLLLVGDHNDGAESLPAWPFPGYSYYTDLFYGTMGGASDYVPDMHIGRFPVRETSQLANMVNNNQHYEDDVTGAEAWVKKAAFLATDDGSFYDVAEGTQNYVINTYTLPKGYSGIFPNNPQAGGDKLYAITHNAESADVVASLNDDRVMVIYTGHGSPTSWAGPSFSQAQVRALTGVISPYVVGHACVTSDFTTNESFGDTWVIQNGKGALTYVGTSNNSYWDEDDVMERVIFDTLYADPLDVPSVGEIKWAGLMAVQTAYPPSANYYWEEYHLFGDPSLVIVMGPRTPDFTLAADPTSFAMCSTDTVTADLTVGS